MNSLICRFNEIQEINKELKIQSIKLPQIVVIGSQSSGKSSVLESVVGSDFFPKGKGMVTRCPLRLELLNGEVDGAEFHARFNHKNVVFQSYNEISREIKNETNNRTTNTKTISEDELVLEITGPKFPTLTLVDLPGLIQNIENDQPKDLDTQIKELMKKYIESPNSIILAISPANVDLATSEIVKYAKAVDPQGIRTIHVLTKLDIMNDGESAQDPLNCEYLSQSVAVIGVVNRSERDVQRSLSIEEQRAKENNFFAEKYPQLASKHGTMYLLKTLEKLLTRKIEQFIPQFERTVQDNILKYEGELMNLNPDKKKNAITNFMIDFCAMFKDTLSGDLRSYSEKLEGGALISQCLYEHFLSNIKNSMVTYVSDDTIELIVRNTAGTKDIIFSFEKPFMILIRREIETFRSPCQNCLREVEGRLKEFVDFVLEKIKFVNYPSVAEKIKEIALEIIDERTKKVDAMIEDYILSEMEDVTHTNPFEPILDNIKSQSSASKKAFLTEDFARTTSIIKSTVEKSGSKTEIPKYYEHIHMAISAFGLASKLKKAHDSNQSDEVLSIVNQVVDRDIGLDTLKTQINEHLKKNEKDFMRKFIEDNDIIGDKESKGLIQKNQVNVIKKIMCPYFEMVQNNIINYVPKTIQVFLIKDLSRQMLESFIRISEKELEDMTYDNSDTVRTQNLINDLEKSRQMRDKLKTLRF